MKTTEKLLKEIAIAIIVVAFLGYMVKCALDCKKEVNSLTEVQLNEVPNHQIY